MIEDALRNFPEGRQYVYAYGSWGPGEKNRTGGSGINMMVITWLRRWAERAMGPSHMKIVRSDEGTKVTLRFLTESGIYEVDVKELNALRKRKVKPPQLREAILLLCETL
ncbi:MAG: hypothetical protein ABR949_10060 [Candidatus Aquilonibacter sp.]